MLPQSDGGVVDSVRSIYTIGLKEWGLNFAFVGLEGVWNHQRQSDRFIDHAPTVLGSPARTGVCDVGIHSPFNKCKKLIELRHSAEKGADIVKAANS